MTLLVMRQRNKAVWRSLQVVSYNSDQYSVFGFLLVVRCNRVFVSEPFSKC